MFLLIHKHELAWKPESEADGDVGSETDSSRCIIEMMFRNA